MKISGDAIERAKKIKLIIFDVDGVLTNGEIYYGENGEFFKVFNCRDGFGITAAHKLGLKTAIITGRSSVFTAKRAEYLGISSVKQNCMNKRNAYKEVKAEFNVDDEEIAYIADDIIDLPVFVQVGFRVAVADAVAEVKERADFIANNLGGNGAAREAIEFILKAQGKWAKLIQDYTTIEDSADNFANIGQ